MDRLSTDVGSSDLTDYGARLRRRWWALALGLLLGLCAGLLYTASQTKTYRSTTSVLVSPVAGTSGAVDGGRTNTEVNLDTESQIVRSARVAAAARTLLAVSTPVADLQRQVSVTVPPNSSVLDITFDAGQATSAQQGSHAFAEAYLADRATQAKRAADAQITNLQAQLTAAQDQLRAASDRSAAIVANSPDKVLAESQRTIAVNQVNDLLARLAPLQNAATDVGAIITDAPLPSKASSPVPALNIGAGLVAGLLIGLATAALADRADHRLRRPSDVTRKVGLPVLASIEGGSVSPLDDAHAAQYDRLRNTLARAGGTSRVLQVADAGPRGASSTVATQLAESLARSHGDALLVVAHPGSALPGAAGADGSPGLVDVLRGTRTLEQVTVAHPALPGVRLVLPGSDVDALEPLLQSPAARTVFDGLAAGSTPVVVETLDTGSSAAAQAVAAHGTTLLVVAERGRTDAREATEAADGGRAVGADVVGLVLVPAFVRRAAEVRTVPPQAAWPEDSPLSTLGSAQPAGRSGAGPGADSPRSR
ncbi:MAG TPA: Wzz/FepE/Etk N-terminal domain-containing protein [Mycobacteriales bacterium]|nr:Wzz/FepE/Etk N-terminal domain-containing protein [Mycobacteriales bacterium]